MCCMHAAPSIIEMHMQIYMTILCFALFVTIFVRICWMTATPCMSQCCAQAYLIVRRHPEHPWSLLGGINNRQSCNGYNSACDNKCVMDTSIVYFCKWTRSRAILRMLDSWENLNIRFSLIRFHRTHTHTKLWRQNADDQQWSHSVTSGHYMNCSVFYLKNYFHMPKDYTKKLFFICNKIWRLKWNTKNGIHYHTFEVVRCIIWTVVFHGQLHVFKQIYIGMLCYILHEYHDRYRMFHGPKKMA